MFGIHNYTSFVLAVIVFQMIPGPGTIAILSSTARGGIRSGMGAVLGTLAGDFLFMFSAVLGLAALLAARPALLQVLQWAGIVYLCGLGLKLLLSPGGSEESQTSSGQNPWTHFRRAFAVCLTNPKAIVFFVAFFPLFLTPGSNSWTLGLLMAHVSLISLVYQTGLVLAGNAVAVRLSRFRQARVVGRRLAGLALIGFGLRLAVNRR